LILKIECGVDKQWWSSNWKNCK